MRFSPPAVVLVYLLAAICAAGFFTFGRPPLASPGQPQGVAPAMPPPVWTAVADGIDAWDGTLSGTQARLVLYRFAAGAFVWKVGAMGAAKTVDDWAAALPDAAFVANGSYFNADGSPSGFAYAGGARVGARQFDLDRSVFLLLGAHPLIAGLAAADLEHPTFADALQSYPSLVDAGRAAIATDTGYVSRRTFFGLDRDGRAYVGLVPEGFVTLRELADGLATLPIPWTSVLNLDGGPSSGAWLRGTNGFPSLSPVGNVIYAVPTSAANQTTPR